MKKVVMTLLMLGLALPMFAQWYNGILERRLANTQQAKEARKRMDQHMREKMAEIKQYIPQPRIEEIEKQGCKITLFYEAGTSSNPRIELALVEGSKGTILYKNTENGWKQVGKNAKDSSTETANDLFPFNKRVEDVRNAIEDGTLNSQSPIADVTSAAMYARNDLELLANLFETADLANRPDEEIEKVMAALDESEEALQVLDDALGDRAIARDMIVRDAGFDLIYSED